MKPSAEISAAIAAEAKARRSVGLPERVETDMNDCPICGQPCIAREGILYCLVCDYTIWHDDLDKLIAVHNKMPKASKVHPLDGLHHTMIESDDNRYFVKQTREHWQFSVVGDCKTVWKMVARFTELVQ